MTAIFIGPNPYHVMDFDPILDGFERLDIRVRRIAPVLEFVHVVDQIGHDGLHVVGGVEAQDVRGLLDADLVIAEVLDVLDAEVDAQPSVPSTALFTRSPTSPTV